MTAGFEQQTVAIFESRMAEVMAKSVASHGGVPLVAPSMREIPLDDHAPILDFAKQLFAGQIDVLICMTGVGTRLLLQTLEKSESRARVLEALQRVTIVARGPKPIRVLQEYKLPVAVAVPEPNTWREIVQALDTSERGVALDGRAVAIQEYGVPTDRLAEALRTRGARIVSVPVYRWALPEDTAPLARAIREIIDGRVAFALLTNAAQSRHVLEFAATQQLEQPLRKALARVVVASVGPTTTEALMEQGIGVDFEPTHPKMGPLITELAAQAATLRKQKVSVPGSKGTRWPQQHVPLEPGTRRDSPFLKACRREPTPYTPIWLMRQAGRYLPEYRAIRRQVPFLELCKRPDLVAEITALAVRKLGVDAAILFSDLLVIVEPLGLGLEYSPSDGPVIPDAVTTAAQIDKLREIDPAELSFVFEGVRQSRAALEASMPLIGFAGAPFTLASYVIEGGASRSFLDTKRLMYSDPGAWHALLGKISRGVAGYLNGQIAAGADAVQLFDSWVGCLSPSDYAEFVLPHTHAVIQALTPGVPVIHFATGNAALLPLLRDAGGDVISVDFRVELDAAWQQIGYDRAIQGNLDPVLLCSPPDLVRARAQRILQQAGGRPGHIFNLGHGVLPQASLESVFALIDEVHTSSRR